MTGVTSHGIRYPDGATKAKNLGPELQQMAEDIDTYIDTEIDASNPAFVAMAREAVDEEIDTRDLLEGSDPRVPKIGDRDRFRVRDNRGQVAVEVDPAGDTHVHGALTQGTARSLAGKSDGWRIRDTAGRVAFEVTPDGRTHVYDLVADIPDPGTGVEVQRIVFLILLGQSNAEGRGQPYGPRLDPPHARIKMAGWSAGVVSEIVPATVPLSSQLHQVGLSFGTVIARDIAAETDESTQVVILNAAVGGSGLVSAPLAGSWAVGYAGSNPRLYPAALGAITTTLNLIAGLHPGKPVEPWLYWHQGEADSSTSEAAYAAALDSLVDGVRAHLGDATVPFTAGGLVPEMIAATPSLAPIRRALYGVQSRKQYAAYTDGIANGGGSQLVNDTVHYGRAGVERLGARMRRASLRAAASTTSAVPHKPLDVTATRNGSTVQIAWTEPEARFTGFLVEYQIDAGGWQTAARDIAEECAQQVTGITGVTVRVRVSTKNGALTSEPTMPITATGA